MGRVRMHHPMIVCSIEGRMRNWNVLIAVHLVGCNVRRVAGPDIVGSMLEVEWELVLVCHLGHHVWRVWSRLGSKGLPLEVLVV